MIKSRTFIAIGIMAVTCLSASAASIGYMSATSEPWGITGSESLPAAMNSAFGAGNWDRLNFSAGATPLTSGYDFIYIDGGDGNSGEFETYINANRAALVAFVTAGGNLFLNAARWTTSNLDLGFGATMVYHESITGAAAVAHPIFDATTGTSWTGNYFSHDTITGAGLTTLITNQYGESVLSERDFGAGHVLLGGMTTPFFHDPDPQGQALRVNILEYAAQGGTQNVPDGGSTFALLGIAVVGIGFISRRQLAVAAVRR